MIHPVVYDTAERDLLLHIVIFIELVFQNATL